MKQSLIKKIGLIMAILYPYASLAVQADKSQVIFLWDLHNVIIKRDYKKMAEIIWNFEGKWQIIQQLNKPTLLAIWHAIVADGSTEEIITVAHEHKNDQLAIFIPLICNAQQPIDGVYELIKELHERRYKHYIGSNIGTKTFKELINNQNYPELFKLFAFFELEASLTVSLGQVKKPSPLFFLHFLESNNIDLQHTTVIFIDDDQKNIQAAQKVGLRGIHFKNSTQLSQDLERALSVIQEQPI